MLPRIVASNSRRHVFQYKVLNNALYLNKHLYIFKLSDTKLCSFSNQEDESIIHLFGNYHKSKTLCNSSIEFLKANLPLLTPQVPSLDSLQTDQELFLILNSLLLLFK